MRRAARIDANQNKIVEAWRNAGASVKLVHQLKNFCDAIVAYNGTIFIAEIKDGSKGKSKLTTGEQAYKDEIELRGCKYHMIESVNQALKMIESPESSLTQDQAREYLEIFLNKYCLVFNEIKLPVWDQNVKVLHSKPFKGSVIEEMTFRGLLKIAYDLREPQPKPVTTEEKHPGVIGHERTCECKECKLLKKIFG